MKHAASVRPEPGSNSPLSESLFLSALADLTHYFRLALASLVLFSFAFELTSFLRLLLFFFQGSDLKINKLLFAIYSVKLSALNFLHILVITGFVTQASYQLMSKSFLHPTFFIIPSQNLMSTTF